MFVCLPPHLPASDLSTTAGLWQQMVEQHCHTIVNEFSTNLPLLRKQSLIIHFLTVNDILFSQLMDSYLLAAKQTASILPFHQHVIVLPAAKTDLAVDMPAAI